jgi:hypothetical protein
VLRSETRSITVQRDLNQAGSNIYLNAQHIEPGGQGVQINTIFLERRWTRPVPPELTRDLIVRDTEQDELVTLLRQRRDVALGSLSRSPQTAVQGMAGVGKTTLAQVHLGEGTDEYRNPIEFFRRTYLTESLGRLLVGALQRLTGAGGDPVVQLQTNFGGGKTHSMLALYHLVSGVSPTELTGIDSILKAAGATTLPTARRVVLVGNKISPGNPVVKADGTVVRTLWGELAWQLGGREAFERVRLDDEQATSPGDVLRELFNDYGPCLILIDERMSMARARCRCGSTVKCRTWASTPHAGGWRGRSTLALPPRRRLPIAGWRIGASSSAASCLVSRRRCSATRCGAWWPRPLTCTGMDRATGTRPSRRSPSWPKTEPSSSSATRISWRSGCAPICARQDGRL